MKTLLTTLLLLPILAFGQTTVCDSLTIDNIFVNDSTGFVEVTVTNNSSEIFSYPGWILFDGNMDTIAVETVNLFGFLGQNTFYLEIQNGMTYPFTGELGLYTGFYDSLWCTFPVTIDSTMVGVDLPLEESVEVFPNPVKDQLSIQFGEIEVSELKLYNNSGQLIYSDRLKQQRGTAIDFSNWPVGLYHLVLMDNQGRLINRKVSIE